MEGVAELTTTRERLLLYVRDLAHPQYPCLDKILDDIRVQFSFMCENCGVRAVNMAVCGRCKAAAYRSVQCQKSAYAGHKARCLEFCSQK